jgi:energy-coupling factor transporter ATP-binding protein EcfA2
MPLDARYHEPFFWWGPGWGSPAPLGIGDLLRNGTIDVAPAAILWAALARRTSIVVIGGPSGLGKSTLLLALNELLPPETERLYLRGCFETFAFLADPAVDPNCSALLINEISPHLPVYLWGPAVDRALDAALSGFALLATAHGESVAAFVASLTGSPLRIPAAKLSAFEVVVVLEPSATVESGRQVSEVWHLRPTRLGLGMDPVSLTSVDASSAASHNRQQEPQDSPFPTLELQQRAGLLGNLRDGVIECLPAVSIPNPDPCVVLNDAVCHSLP